MRRSSFDIQVKLAALALCLVGCVLTRQVALAAGLALGLAATWLIGRSSARRVARITRFAEAVARGKLREPPIGDTSSDHVGDLGRAVDAMTARLVTLVDCIEADGREETARLDAVVSERTAELRRRNEELAFFLENLGQGFMTVARTGELAPERSAILARWFGSAETDVRFWDYVGRHDPHAAKWLAVGWESVFDGLLPPELAADQLPKELRVGPYRLGVRYQPISDERGEIMKVIVVITDISDEIARRRAEETQKELAIVCARVVSDPRSVELFLTECGALVQSLRAPRSGACLVEERRSLHTLKGNAAFIGLGRLADLSHQMETHIVETGDPAPASARASLDELFEDFRSKVEPLLSNRRRDEVGIARSALHAHIEGIRRGLPRPQLIIEPRLWLLEPARDCLERAADQARAVARRLQKPEPNVVIEDRGVRLDAHVWAAFWSSFVHVVRNAVDHGIEDPASRVRAAKPSAGTLALRARQTTTDTEIEIEDDGAGIDWDGLRRRAVAIGLVPVDDAARDPVDLLFADGVSTKVEVTDTSGRGVGAGACRLECEALGGRVEVKSERGVGTKLTFRVPRPRFEMRTRPPKSSAA